MDQFHKLLMILPMMYFKCESFCQNVTTMRMNATSQDWLENFSKLDFFSNINDWDNETETVKIGFLGAYGRSQVLLGALPAAVEAVNNDPDILPGKKLHYIAANIGTNINNAKAIQIMTAMRDNRTLAFIGPDDTCYSEALVAAAWNIPMISYKCTDTSVSNKTIFPTFGRTLPPSSKVSKSVVALLQTFNWHRFVLISGSHPGTGSVVRAAIEELSATQGLIVTDVKIYSTDYIPQYIDQMDNIVADTYQRTRIYVFVGEHIALIDFIKCLQRRNLLSNGEYIVISVDDEIYDPNKKINILRRDYLDPFISIPWNDATDITGFKSVLKITPTYPTNPEYRKIQENIKTWSTKPPFCVPYHYRIFKSISVPIQAAYLYDAVVIYAKALTEVFLNDENPKDGANIVRRISNKSYQSIQGYDVYIDGNGDAEGNFTVVVLMDDVDINGSFGMSMQPVGYFQYRHNGNIHSTDLPEFRYINESRRIRWLNGKVPEAEPRCGFFGEKCVPKIDWRLFTVTAFASVIFLITILFIVKYYRYEKKLACMLWKIDIKDIIIIPTETVESCTGSHKSMMIQVYRLSVFRTPTDSINGEESTPKRAYTQVGIYRNNIVAIKKIYKKNIDMTRAIKKELKQIREVRHENINQFIGACVDPGNVAIVTAYTARGSLEDVLANTDLHLDKMFISSLITDMLKGLIYIHDSEIISHGNFKSSNCLIDSRWVLQITDFGLHQFKAGEDDLNFEEKELRRSLWRAPELLRLYPHGSPRGTQKGDVYSFGIVLYETLGRNGPWGNIKETPKEIVDLVKKENQADPFRPKLDHLNVDNYIIRCIKLCWLEESEQRPDIRLVRVSLKEMQSGLKPNIFDNMLAIMEKYAYNLEGLVQERTNQLMEEKKKTEALLHRMLPKSVAEALKKGHQVEAEMFDCVTIYFSDIVDFTELSAHSTPFQVINLLNELYTLFDSIIPHYDVYKVETIGDAYMVASGLPIRNGDRHAGEIASMALHLLSEIRLFEVKHRKGQKLQLRIGIHSGRCVAGVVGLKMPRYCLFGDTVNTASRMESTGQPFKIHISYDTYTLLQKIGGYECEERGFTQVKGKGMMRTFWLIRVNSSRQGHADTPDLLKSPKLKANETFGEVSSNSSSSSPRSLNGNHSVSMV